MATPYLRRVHVRLFGEGQRDAVMLAKTIVEQHGGQISVESIARCRLSARLDPAKRATAPAPERLAQVS
jgi:hypothetical protein